MTTNFILPFDQIGLSDIARVGGKNASLGELVQALKLEGVHVPDGFAISAEAYEAILRRGEVRQGLQDILKKIDKNNVRDLQRCAKQARKLILDAGLPDDVCDQIKTAYAGLTANWGDRHDVAVRSSATAEDLPEASFAGQLESFVNVRGESALLEACLNCFASMFTERAIAYRIDKGFDHLSVKVSIGVQKMVRSDLASAGVIFTLDPDSGFRNVVLVTSSYGLGESVVAGRVDPDEFVVFKPNIGSSSRPIVKKKCGAKQTQIIYSKHGPNQTRVIPVPKRRAGQYSLTDSEVMQLAHWACAIENHYSKRNGRDTPMDVEWAKDGDSGVLYIVQARPETVHARDSEQILVTYHLEEESTCLLEGESVGDRIGSGKVRVASSANRLSSFKDGEVLVAEMTDPDWEPVMKRASAIVTDRGGRTCHAAIISRELGIPCVVGTHEATRTLHSGQPVTVSCAESSTGKVYEGRLKYKTEKIVPGSLPDSDTKLMLNVAVPETAFSVAHLPVSGVGLVREEFIIANDIKIHPLALLRFGELKTKSVKSQIKRMTEGYKRKELYFVHKLAEGIGTIAAAFHPRDVIVRLSDFKTNEYANLIGGSQFEPKEENPMIGFRGASRYYSEYYRDAFALECQALQKVRQEMGLNNIKIMIPFCRTVDEAERVIGEMQSHGLIHHADGLEFYMMCELPSNVLLIDQFARIFDGFSIGSNDLTQLILGVDRDSETLSELFDEQNEAVLRAIEQAIRGAHFHGRKIGICGEAPSDYPDVVRFLVNCGIDSISLNEDALAKTLLILTGIEKSQKAPAKFKRRPVPFGQSRQPENALRRHK